MRLYIRVTNLGFLKRTKTQKKKSLNREREKEAAIAENIWIFQQNAEVRTK